MPTRMYWAGRTRLPVDTSRPADQGPVEFKVDILDVFAFQFAGV